MKVQEAYSTLMAEKQGRIVVNCHEYPNCYVFYAPPSGQAIDGVFDSLFSVDKKTGQVAVFRPLDIPADEYKRGKRITIYDRK